MSTPIINQNLNPVRNPELKDILDLHQKKISLNLNCHHLGTIQSFDATKQTAVITINYKKTYFKQNASNQYVSFLEDYPILYDCPVVIMGGGSTRITFPITQGDQCLVLFNDRDIDNWFDGSTTSANQTPRLHSFADALALIGPNNKNTLISGYDDTRALITNGTVKVMESIDKIINSH